MDSYIQMVYGFDEMDLIEEDNRYLIKSHGNVFYLYEVEDLNSVFSQYQLSLKYPFFWQFIFSLNHSIIEEFQGNYYVLLEESNKRFSFLDSLLLLPIQEFKKFDWRELWLQKSDYLSNNCKTIRERYPLIDESFDYYYGLLEYSIFLLKDYSPYTFICYVQHSSFCFSDYYNPLTLKLDFKERDLAEYLKELFFLNDYKQVSFTDFFQKYRDYDYNLVFARLFYPNYYFDLMDLVDKGKKKESDFDRIIRRSLEYENYLQNLYVIVSNYYPIKKISFFQIF